MCIYLQLNPCMMKSKATLLITASTLINTDIRKGQKMVLASTWSLLPQSRSHYLLYSFLIPLFIPYQYAYQLHCKIIFRRCLFLTPLSSFSPKRCHLTYFLTLLLALIFHKIFSANFKNIKHIMPLPCLKLSRGFLWLLKQSDKTQNLFPQLSWFSPA